MTDQPTPFEFAFAGVTLIAENLHTGRHLYRRRSTYQLLTRLDEVIEALLADDLSAPRPWSTVLVESASEPLQKAA